MRDRQRNRRWRISWVRKTSHAPRGWPRTTGSFIYFTDVLSRVSRRSPFHHAPCRTCDERTACATPAPHPTPRSRWNSAINKIFRRLFQPKLRVRGVKDEPIFVQREEAKADLSKMDPLTRESDEQIRHLLDLIRRAAPFSSRLALPIELLCCERFQRC